MTISIVTGQQAAKLETKAAQLFAERSYLRSGIDAAILTERLDEESGPVIVIGTPDSCGLIRQAYTEGVLKLPENLGEEGFVIQGGGGSPVYVAACTARGVLYGLGKLLRLIDWAAGLARIPPLQIVSRPNKPVRGIYFATHFGNWYCHAELEEVRSYLEDLALWGINELLVWFDISHYRNLEEGRPMLQRLAKFEAFAREVGMKTGRITIPNEGFLGQVGEGRPMLSTNAFDGIDYHPLRSRDRVFGGFDTDICPSIPAGRELVLHNKKQYFSELADVQSLWFWPYDSGGCNCPQCLPWPSTFMELNRELAASVRELVPGMTINVSAWWFEGHRSGEDDAFFNYLEEDRQQTESWFTYIMAGAAETKRWKREGRVVPERHPVVLFPEISMFDSVPWGGKGGNPAPRKFAGEYAELSGGIAGAFPYSEGIYEDLNKVIWAQLLWHSESEIGRIVAEYCRFYFGAAVEPQATQLIFQMEDIVTGSQPSISAEQLEAQAEGIHERMETWARDGWRWQMVQMRCRLQSCIDQLAALADGRNGHASFPERRSELVERFTTAYDHVQVGLSLHRPGVSLEPWIYAAAGQALDFCLGNADVINLTLANLLDDESSSKVGLQSVDIQSKGT